MTEELARLITALEPMEELARLRTALEPTEENVVALSREMERLFGYTTGTGWRARQALHALGSLLSRQNKEAA